MDPDAVLTFIILDRSSGGDQEQDLSLHYDRARSSFQPTAQGRSKPSKVYISFVATLSFNIVEGQEWYYGYRNPTTKVWDATRQVYGGYIRQSTGGARGNRHTFTLNLVEYDWDLITTHIEVWPDAGHVGTGYPDGGTVSDFLVGQQALGKAYDGLIPARLGSTGGVDLSGVDAGLGSISFSRPPNGQMPGGGPPEAPAYGTWGYCLLRKPIDDIITAISVLYPATDPVAYMEPTVSTLDPTQIRPRFRLVDRNDTSSASLATFATDPGAGEYQIENTNGSFEHQRDITEARQRICVKGAGRSSANSGTAALVAATVYRPDRPGVSPTKYQTEPGRAAVYVDETIRDGATATSEATFLESLAWGAQGRVIFEAAAFVPTGSMITVRNVVENFNNQRFRVYDVDDLWAERKRPLWRYTIGADPPDLGALFQRTTLKAVALAQAAALGVRIGGLTPGVPAGYGLASSPTHSQHNTVLPQSDAIIGLTVRQGYHPAGQPVNPAPALLSQWQYFDSSSGTWKTGANVTPNDAAPHPQQIHCGGLTADATYYITMVRHKLTFAYYAIKGPGTVSFYKNGALQQAGLHSTTGAVAPLASPTTYDPVSFDDLSISVTGTNATTPTYFVLSE